MVEGVYRPGHKRTETHDGSRISGSVKPLSSAQYEHELRRPKSESSIRASTSVFEKNPDTSHETASSAVRDPNSQDVKVPRAHKNRRRGRRGVRKMNISTFTNLEDMSRFIEDKLHALGAQISSLVESRDFTTFESRERRCQVLMKKRNQIKSLVTQCRLTGNVDQNEYLDFYMKYIDGWLALWQVSDKRPKSTDNA
ncbi:hypothetical protein F5Y03DRAFT_336535 [Xylaria venustula]|nr:hypothetical protein F5Y03DRAFT_336535 [Xylaria venustula]